MTKVTEIDYEVKEKEVEKIKCDASGCYERVKEEDATDVKLEFDGESESKHLCPAHSDLPEVIEIRESRDKFKEAIDTALNTAFDPLLATFVFIVGIWMGYFVNTFVIDFHGVPISVKIIFSFIFWFVCAIATLALLSDA